MDSFMLYLITGHEVINVYCTCCELNPSSLLQQIIILAIQLLLLLLE